MKISTYMVIITLLNAGAVLGMGNQKKADSSRATPPYAIPVALPTNQIPYARPVGAKAVSAVESNSPQKRPAESPKKSSYGLFQRFSDYVNGTAVNVHEELLEGNFDGNQDRIKKTVEDSVKQNDITGLLSLVDNLVRQHIEFDHELALQAVETLEKNNTQLIRNLAVKIQKRPLALLSDAEQESLLYTINAYHTSDINIICIFHATCFEIRQKLGNIPATERFNCDKKAIIRDALSQLPQGNFIPAHVISLEQ